MTKQASKNASNERPDALVIERTKFKSDLLDRIDKGRMMLGQTITNMSELETIESDFWKWDDYNEEFLKQAFNNEQNHYMREYRDTGSLIGIFGSSNNGNEKYKRFRDRLESKIHNLENIVQKVDLLKSEIGEKKITQSTIKNTTNPKAVFIVHGHNVALQQTVARTIEKLGLTPIILHEQPNSGRTIIEKFESHSDVSFAIVLLTDDDEGKAKDQIDLKKRARQNVVLELGYFIGKLGRSRVLPLHSAGVELPSDIHGVVYTPIDPGGVWTFAVVKELAAAGYEVDANKLL